MNTAMQKFTDQAKAGCVKMIDRHSDQEGRNDDSKGFARGTKRRFRVVLAFNLSQLFRRQFGCSGNGHESRLYKKESKMPGGVPAPDIAPKNVAYSSRPASL